MTLILFPIFHMYISGFTNAKSSSKGWQGWGSSAVVVVEIVWPNTNCQANLKWRGGGHAQHPFRISSGAEWCFKKCISVQYLAARCVFARYLQHISVFSYVESVCIAFLHVLWVFAVIVYLLVLWVWILIVYSINQAAAIQIIPNAVWMDIFLLNTQTRAA